MRRGSPPVLITVFALVASVATGRPVVVPHPSAQAATPPPSAVAAAPVPAGPAGPGTRPGPGPASRGQDVTAQPGSAPVQPASPGHREPDRDRRPCEPAGGLAPAVGQVPDGLSITAEVGPGTYTTDRASVSVKVYVSNRTAESYVLTGRSEVAVVDRDGHAVGGRFRPDLGSWGEGEETEILPYEYGEYFIELAPSWCGEGEPLPPGTYGVVAALDWSTREGPDAGPRGRWVSEPLPLILEDWYVDDSFADVTQDWHATVPAPDAPCHADGSQCRDPANMPATCSTTPPPNGDFGAIRDLRLTMEPDDQASILPSALGLRFTLENTGDEVVWLSVLNRWDDGWLGSAVLGDHASGRREFYFSRHRYRIEPGRSIRIHGQVSTSTCGITPETPGAPLPPGEYTVTAGVYIRGFGWWFAPPRTAHTLPP